MVSLRAGRLLVISILTLTGLLEAAPQKRSCHASTYTSTTLDTSSAIQSFDSNDNPTPTTPTNSRDGVDTQTSITIRESSPQDSQIISRTLTPEVVLVYPNTTLTLPPSISISIPSTLAFPTTKPAAFNLPSSSPLSPSSASLSTTTSTPSISTNPTFTTPDIQAMQTAYYLHVCSWPEHANDAICLGDNSMLCCQASNPHCQGVLYDGGLDCQGIESGAWATTWVRPTITVGISGADGTLGGSITVESVFGSTSKGLSVSSGDIVTQTASTVATAGFRAIAPASTDDTITTTTTTTTTSTTTSTTTITTTTTSTAPNPTTITSADTTTTTTTVPITTPSPSPPSPTSSIPIIQIIPINDP